MKITKLDNTQVLPFMPEALNRLPVKIYNDFVGIESTTLAKMLKMEHHNFLKKVKRILKKYKFNEVKNNLIKNQKQLTFLEIEETENDKSIFKKSYYYDARNRKQPQYLLDFTAVNFFMFEYNVSKSQFKEYLQVKDMFHQLQNRLNELSSTQWLAIRTKSKEVYKSYSDTIKRLRAYTGKDEDEAQSPEHTYFSTITQVINKELNLSTSVDRNSLDVYTQAVYMQIETLVADFIEARLAEGTSTRRAILSEAKEHALLFSREHKYDFIQVDHKEDVIEAEVIERKTPLKRFKHF